MLRKYGIFGLILLLCSLIRTKVMFRRARLIRFPFEARNRHLMSISSGFTTGKFCRLEAHNDGDIRIKIGRNCQLNDSVHIVGSQLVEIRDNVLIASKVFISDSSHGCYNDSCEQSSPFIPPALRPSVNKSVLINSNVWIGEFVSILPGVVIGEGAVIGSMSVVTKSVPPHSIAVGVPARVVKKFCFVSNKWLKI